MGFTSNLKEKMAQRFFNLILLPRIRDDIDTYHRLNFHLYQALRKALFKPGAFFKGFLLPLCESGTCTLREAIIVGSVLAKNSIPVLHSCAAMLKIAEMEYSGANSIFLRVLLDKKYALPYRVVDSVVFHFLNFEMTREQCTSSGTRPCSPSCRGTSRTSAQSRSRPCSRFARSISTTPSLKKSGGSCNTANVETKKRLKLPPWILIKCPTTNLYYKFIFSEK